jgi:retron-type reverse transcriptase
MEEVLEPKFLECSHGFRPQRGCHSALRSVRSWKGVPLIIEGDIQSFFDSINHNLLAQLIKKYFDDQRLVNLYWKLAKAGYIE